MKEAEVSWQSAVGSRQGRLPRSRQLAVGSWQLAAPLAADSFSPLAANDRPSPPAPLPEGEGSRSWSLLASVKAHFVLLGDRHLEGSLKSEG